MKIKLNFEFAKLELRVNNTGFEEFHANVLPPSTTPVPREENQLDIIMIMYDSTSNANLQRHMKKTYKRLSEDSNTFIMKVRSLLRQMRYFGQNYLINYCDCVLVFTSSHLRHHLLQKINRFKQSLLIWLEKMWYVKEFWKKLFFSFDTTGMTKGDQLVPSCHISRLFPSYPAPHPLHKKKKMMQKNWTHASQSSFSDYGRASYIVDLCKILISLWHSFLFLVPSRYLLVQSKQIRLKDM